MADLEQEDFISDSVADDDRDFCQKLNRDEVLKEDKNFCRLKMHLCKSFHGKVIGCNGKNLFNLESDTHCKIKLPLKKDQSNFIEIQSFSKKNVIAAYERIKEIEKYLRSRQQFTHFVSIPISKYLLIKSRFLEFKSSILSDPKLSTVKNIDESVFQHENRLHLTVQILYLGDSYDRETLNIRFKEFDRTFLRPFIESIQKPIRLQFKGIDIMNDDPSQTHVLYAKCFEIEQNNHFKQIVNKLYEWTMGTGLDCYRQQFESSNSDYKIKLHMTLMNSRYRGRNQENFDGNFRDDEIDDLIRQKNDANKEVENNSKQKNDPMDVEEILKRFGDFDFGTIEINEIQIATRQNYDVDGSYRTLSRISW